MGCYIIFAQSITFLSTLSLRRATLFLRCGPMTRRYFYPRSPCGERPIFAVRPYDAPIFLSTLSLRRATLMWYQCNTVVKISIHALLAESDNTVVKENTAAITISIHALLAESDIWTYQRHFPPYISIHALLAESDLFLRSGPMTHPYFYPRSPCGERRIWPYQRHFASDISIHALLAESDSKEVNNGRFRQNISIHALLAESDPLR